MLLDFAERDNDYPVPPSFPSPLYLMTSIPGKSYSAIFPKSASLLGWFTLPSVLLGLVSFWLACFACCLVAWFARFAWFAWLRVLLGLRASFSSAGLTCFAWFAGFARFAWFACFALLARVAILDVTCLLVAHSLAHVLAF